MGIRGTLFLAAAFGKSVHVGVWEVFNSELVHNVFYEDGSLRDIYVFDTTVKDWQCIMDYFISAHVTNTFYVDGEPHSIPKLSTDIFLDRQFMWSIEYEGILFNTHFFGVTEIEFDVNPSDVKTADKANHVVMFMTKLAQLTNKAVVLTPENCPESPLFKLNSDGSLTIY